MHGTSVSYKPKLSDASDMRIVLWCIGDRSGYRNRNNNVFFYLHIKNQTYLYFLYGIIKLLYESYSGALYPGVEFEPATFGY